MKIVVLLLTLLAGTASAGNAVIADKVVLPEVQFWNYHNGGFWEWYPKQYALLFDSGNVTKEGETIYDAVIVPIEDWDYWNTGDFYYEYFQLFQEQEEE